MKTSVKKLPVRKSPVTLELDSEVLAAALQAERARLEEMLTQTQNASRLDDSDGKSDEVDLTNDLATAETFYAVSENLERKLYEIENAIRRLTQGNYGLCRECDEEIPMKRLIAKPSADLCVSCQAESERGRLSA